MHVTRNATRNDSGAWADVLSKIKETCTPQQFETWFRYLTPAYFEDERLELLVPNRFHKDWLTRNYLGLIRESVREVTGRSYEVSMRVDAHNPLFKELEHEYPLFAQAPKSDPGNRSAQRRVECSSDILLNRNYVFENFIVGPSNRVSHAAAQAVVATPGKAYNPLFLYGAVGLGKTHLLQAICHTTLERMSESRILLLSCETFVNHFISAIETGKLNDFRYKYRHVDILMIDDIQFLANKERSQEEFFHTFNTLYNSEKQIILTCDSSPKEIRAIEARLVSRFKWGLVTHLDRPDYETRVAICHNKARLMNFNLPEEVGHLVAETFDANVRELEGAITKIVSHARALGRSPNVDLARTAFRDLLDRRPSIGMGEILAVVGNRYGVKKGELVARTRVKSIAYPRQVAMYLARRHTSLSLEEIGKFFAGRDHSTVLYACEKIKELLQNDSAESVAIRDVERELRS